MVALTEAKKELQPVNGLPFNTQGKRSQKGTGDSEFVQIIIAGFEGIPESTGKLTSDSFWIRTTSIFSLYLQITLGDHTALFMRIMYSDDDSTWYDSFRSGGFSAGVITSVHTQYKFTASGNFILTLTNPSARYIKFEYWGNNISDSGTLAAYYLRGWSRRIDLVGVEGTGPPDA